MTWLLVFAILMLGGFAVLAAVVVRRRNMHLWLGGYVRATRRNRRRSSHGEPKQVFIAVCDHFEPQWGHPPMTVADGRVARWRNEYPRLFDCFSDSTGRPPQHTFFFPQDEYVPEHLDVLAELCREGFGDVDVHLHHDHDTPDALREKLEEFRDALSSRHGLLRRDPISGRVVYGFVHGNWALCNSRPDGRWCGVNGEISILRETGCYADFTMPSAPDCTQTRTVNSIYYAQNRPGSTKSHDRGVAARVGRMSPEEALLMIQGPLLLDWSRRKWGLLPRIENGDLHSGNPASLSRFKLWMQAGVHVEGRPDWLFVKLHTHGAKDGNIDSLLGRPMQQFHRDLARMAKEESSFRYYYVTAWEMAQLVHRAERGETRESASGKRYRKLERACVETRGEPVG